MPSRIWGRFGSIPRRWRQAGLIALLLVAGLLLSRQVVLQLVYPLPYRDEIYLYSQQNGLDPLFVASIVYNESGFRPSAVSPEGAVGLMQIMPDTGRWVAEQLGFAAFDPEMLEDPATNIMIGTWYLAELKREFGGKLVLVVAAYNAGRGRVREWVERDGFDPGTQVAEITPWPGDEVIIDYPLERISLAETRSYVQNVMASLVRYRQLYGETITP